MTNLLKTLPALPSMVYVVEEDKCIAITLGESGYRTFDTLEGYDAHWTAFWMNRLFVNSALSSNETLKEATESLYRLGSMFGWDSGEIPELLTSLNADIAAVLAE